MLKSHGNPARQGDGEYNIMGDIQMKLRCIVREKVVREESKNIFRGSRVSQ